MSFEIRDDGSLYYAQPAHTRAQAVDNAIVKPKPVPLVHVARWGAIKALLVDVGHDDIEAIADSQGIPSFPRVPIPRKPASIRASLAPPEVKVLDTVSLNPVKLARVHEERGYIVVHLERRLFSETFAVQYAIAYEQLIHARAAVLSAEHALEQMKRVFPDFDKFTVFERTVPPDDHHKFVIVDRINSTAEPDPSGRPSEKHYVMFRELGDIHLDNLQQKIVSLPDWCQRMNTGDDTMKPAFVPHFHTWGTPLFLDDPDHKPRDEAEDRLMRELFGDPSSDYDTRAPETGAVISEEDPGRLLDMKRHVAAGFLSLAYGPGVYVQPCVHGCGYLMPSWDKDKKEFHLGLEAQKRLRIAHYGYDPHEQV